MIRRGRPGLLGTMARTAVITGTATAVSGSIQNRQRAAAQQQAAAQQAAAPVAPPPPAAPALPPEVAPLPPTSATAAGGDLMGDLARLGQMKSAGLIDETEFTAAKARLLGL